MDPGIYKIIHFVGLFALFTGIGALITVDHKKPAARILPSALHGIGWLLLLVSGIGMWHKMHGGFPVWIIGKFVILLALGAIVALIKREKIPSLFLYLIAITLGSLAAYLGFSNGLIMR
ncbi:MAG: hypothetical protein ACON38_07735 [Akkermansiaceae bacterium]